MLFYPFVYFIFRCIFYLMRSVAKTINYFVYVDLFSLLPWLPVSLFVLSLILFGFLTRAPIAFNARCTLCPYNQYNDLTSSFYLNDLVHLSLYKCFETYVNFLDTILTNRILYAIHICIIKLSILKTLFGNSKLFIVTIMLMPNCYLYYAYIIYLNRIYSDFSLLIFNNKF